MDLFQQNGKDGKLKYEFELSKEVAEKLAEKLGLLKDSNVSSIPQELPTYSRLENHVAVILVETGFGISFTTETKKEVETVLSELGFDTYDAEREWV